MLLGGTAVVKVVTTVWVPGSTTAILEEVTLATYK